MRAPALAGAASLWIAASVWAEKTEPLDVEIAAPDGFSLAATYYAAAKPGPGVLLLHQCNRDRWSWDELARSLTEAGLHVLTLDFRGFGESTSREVPAFHTAPEKLWPFFDQDVERAFEFLVSLPEVDRESVGVAGASCGGSQAMLLATRHPEVKAVVFLSSALPWVEEADVAAFEQNRSVPILAIASEEYRGTARRTERIFHNSTHPETRMILYKGAHHGVPLFEHDPTLVRTITNWFASHL